MRTFTKTSLLRLPKKLSFTALGVAALGTFACSSTQSSGTADAAVDAREEHALSDAPTDASDATQDSAMDSTTADVAMDTADDVPGDVVADGCAEVYFCIPIVDGGVCPMNSLCDPSQCPDAQCEIEAV
jgi:hypothetical protein